MSGSSGEIRALGEEVEAFFRRLIEASPEPQVVHLDGRLIYANQAALDLLAGGREQVIGRSIWDFVPVEERAAISARVDSVVRERRPAPPRVERLLRLDGSALDVEVRGMPFSVAGRPAVHVVIRDVTDRLRAELVQTATYRIAQAALECRSLEELFPAIHRIVADLMPAQNFYIALYDRDGESLSFPYFVDEGEPPPLGAVPLGTGLTEYVLRTGEPLLASPEVFAALLDRGEVEEVGAPSIDWLGVPLRLAGVTTGVLVVQSYVEGVRFDTRHRDILQFVGDQVAMAIERRRGEDAERLREQLLERVAEAVSAATGDAFLRTLVLELASALGVAFAFVGGLTSRMRDAGRGGQADAEDLGERVIETLAVAVDGAIAENFAYSLTGSPCEQVIGDRLCVFPDRVAEQFPADVLLAELGVRCYLGVALHDSSGQPLGLLVVMDRKPLRSSDTARALLQIFATRAAAELERVGVELALRTSEERYRLFIEQSSEAIWCVELDEPMPLALGEDAQIAHLRRHGHIVECNAALATMYGYERREELLGRPSRELLPLDAPGNDAYYRAAVRSGYRLVDAESRERDRFGELRVVLNNLVGVIEDGHLLRIWGTARDITERRRAEALLEQQAAAIRASMDGMAIVDAAGKLAFVNDAYTRMHGYGSAEELLGLPWETCFPAGESERLRGEVVPAVRATGAWRGATSGRRRDGSSFPQELSLSPIEGRGLVAVVRDVTERRSLEEQLRQAQKMEAVGRLAGGVAHDFNNLLTAITGYSDLLLARLGAEHPLRREVEEIKRAGVRAADLTRQLLAFSRRQVLSTRLVSLNRVVADMEKLLRRVIGEDVQLVTDLDPRLAAVRADPGQLEQVILNLAVNARDAMPRGGSLALRTRNVRLDGEQARRFLDLEPGELVLLEVSDSGVGIAAEVCEHIFEPFFTTKELGRGTGLGLSMVYGIVRQSGGHIEVQSTPGQGSVFRLYFPTASGLDAEPPVGPAPPRAVRGHETVLVVEDEPAVQQLVRRILEDQGYRVLVAPHGVAALGLADHGIDLLLTDVVMPGMSGAELAERLRRQVGELAVLFMSGYNESFVGRLGVDEPGDQFLQKPFTPDVLAQRVRDALDSRRRA